MEKKRLALLNAKGKNDLNASAISDLQPTKSQRVARKHFTES